MLNLGAAVGLYGADKFIELFGDIAQSFMWSDVDARALFQQSPLQEVA